MDAVPFWFALQSMKIKPWQIQGIRCFCNANGIESAKGSFSQGFLYFGTDALFKKLLQAFVLEGQDHNLKCKEYIYTSQDQSTHARESKRQFGF